jgi:murein DD-endopeptidase MepM/ murein hydrolase activator NlpD
MTRKLSRRTFTKALGSAATALAIPTVLTGTASAFSDGDRVTPTTALNTRYRPGTESRILATMSAGTEGEIMNGPVNEDGYTWWGVHWLADDIWGWSAGQYLTTSGGGGGGGSETDFVWPISGIVTSPYGPRGSGFHAGIDIDGGGIGEPIYAARAGTAYARYDAGGYGNYVVIDHGSGYLTEYGHVNSFSFSDGEYVSRGEHIAGMGSTGNSTGPHLHLSIEQNGSPRNPIPASDGSTVTAGTPIPRDYAGI